MSLMLRKLYFRLSTQQLSRTMVHNNAKLASNNTQVSHASYHKQIYKHTETRRGSERLWTYKTS
jgi:hypothetical protein